MLKYRLLLSTETVYRIRVRRPRASNINPNLGMSGTLDSVNTPDIDELFHQTLRGEYEDDAPWEALHHLRRIGTRDVFHRAVDWSRSSDPLRRARGCDVLSQLGKTADHPTNNFPEECYLAVYDVVLHETESRPLGSAIAALGHIGDPRAIPLITATSKHPDRIVRFDVACALGCFPNDQASVIALLALTEDDDDDVRDWATFGLGVLGDSDSKEIRDALFRRLSDSNDDVREEAMAGLGKRKDPCLLPTLLEALKQRGDFYRVREAAYSMLGMQSDREDWSAADYAAALREAYPNP